LNYTEIGVFVRKLHL